MNHFARVLVLYILKILPGSVVSGSVVPGSVDLPPEQQSITLVLQIKITTKTPKMASEFFVVPMIDANGMLTLDL